MRCIVTPLWVMVAGTKPRTGAGDFQSPRWAALRPTRALFFC
jgi:hypothetical protein